MTGAMRLKFCLGLAATLIVASLSAQDLPALHEAGEAQGGGQARITDPQVVRSLSLASGYHDLANLYIKKGEMEKAAAEARHILQLDLPAEHEHLVVKSLAIISDKLGEAKRFDLSQSLLDETLRSAEQPLNRVVVLKTKARLYRLAGDDDKAIESFKQALELEGRSIR